MQIFKGAAPAEKLFFTILLALILLLSLAAAFLRCFSAAVLLIMAVLYCSMLRKYVQYRAQQGKLLWESMLVHAAAIVLTGISPMFL